MKQKSKQMKEKEIDIITTKDELEEELMMAWSNGWESAKISPIKVRGERKRYAINRVRYLLLTCEIRS